MAGRLTMVAAEQYIRGRFDFPDVSIGEEESSGGWRIEVELPSGRRASVSVSARELATYPASEMLRVIDRLMLELLWSEERRMDPIYDDTADAMAFRGLEPISYQRLWSSKPSMKKMTEQMTRALRRENQAYVTAMDTTAGTMTISAPRDYSTMSVADYVDELHRELNRAGRERGFTFDGSPP